LEPASFAGQFVPSGSEGAVAKLAESAGLDRGAPNGIAIAMGSDLCRPALTQS
jgi:hypothetical protein